jgi:hypothetical protein
MDRKNYRTGGTMGIATTNSTINGEDGQDETTVWKRILSDLQSLSEIIDSNESINASLDKSEGKV